MAKGPLRVGIVGIGGIGTTHGRAVVKHSGLELAAIHDVSPRFIERARRDFPDSRICASFDDFVNDARLDAAIVATPNNTHARFTLACLKAGMHVLCEKPLGMSVKEAAAMRDAARKARRVGMTNFTYRWIPSFALMRRTVRDGAFGAVRRVHVKYLQSFLMDPQAPLVWRNRIDLAGYGALGDLGSHMIDSVRFITGAEPKRVVGITHIHVKDKPDPATGKRITVTTDTGAQFMVDFGAFVGLFETSQVEPAHGNHLVVSVGGEHGSARIYSEDREGLEIAVGQPYADKVTWATCMPHVLVPSSQRPNYESGSPCIDTFFNAMAKKTKDYPTFDDGLAAQKVLDATLKSSREGKWVKL